MTPALLFVYGTLLNRSDHPRARWLRANAVWLGEAKVEGRLYDLGNYPGMVVAQGADDWVQGDLFDLGNHGDRILAELDVYEGAKYERRCTDAVGGNGETVPAWAYWYRGAVREDQRITSGHYD